MEPTPVRRAPGAESLRTSRSKAHAPQDDGARPGPRPARFPVALAAPDAESLRTSRAFRNTCRRTSEGWPVLANACFAKIDHPLWRLSKVLRNTLASRTQAHTPEDDDARPDHRPPRFPSPMQ